MGMDGAGKAYQKFYAHNTFVPGKGRGVKKPTIQNNFFIKQDSSYVMPQQMCGPLLGMGMYQAPTTGSNFLDGLWGFADSGGFNALGKGLNLILGNTESTSASSKADMSDKEKWAKQFENLKAMYSGKGFNITSNEDGTFNATDKNYNNVAMKKDFDEMCKILGESQGSNTPVDENNNSNVENNENNNNVGDSNNNSNVEGNNGAGGSGGARRSSSSQSPDGWYRAANDKSASVQALKGKNASQVTSAVLGTKLAGVLNKEQQAQLRDMIIKKNPSVFDQSTGEPLKSGGDYSKLDVPTQDWIMKNIVNKGKPESEQLQKGQKTVRQDDQYSGTVKYKAKNGDYIKQDSDGKYRFYDESGSQITEQEFRKRHPSVNATNVKNDGYSSQKGTRLSGSEGRYAEKQKDGSYKYYNSQGQQLKPEYIQKKDPKLWAATHQSANNSQANHPANNGKTHSGSRQPWL